MGVIIVLIFVFSLILTVLSFRFSADEMENLINDFIVNIFIRIYNFFDNFFELHGHQVASILILIVSVLMIFQWLEIRKDAAADPSDKQP